METSGSHMNSIGSGTYERFLRESVGKSGGSLEAAETKMMRAFNTGDQNVIGAAQVEYQKEQRVYNLLMTFIRNLHDMLMQVIRLLKLQ